MGTYPACIYPCNYIALAFDSDLAILGVYFSPGHRTPTARGRQADEGLTESLPQVRRVIT